MGSMTEMKLNIYPKVKHPRLGFPLSLQPKQDNESFNY